MARAKPGGPGWLRILTFLLFLAAVALLVRAVVTAAVFRVGAVSVTGDPQNLVSDQIRRLALGQNTLFFPEEKVRGVVLKNLLIRNVSFSRNLPGGVTAAVTYRTPVLSWQSRHGRYLIDESGLAYQEAGSEPVPQAADPGSDLSLGDRLTAGQVQTTLRVLQAVADKGTVLTISLSGPEVTVQLSNATIVRLDAGGNLDQESSSLQLILAQAKIDGRYPKIIDLRYAKPVVTF